MPALDVFQVIADPSRRHILHLLSEDSLTINALAGNFDMSRPAVSKHVKALEDAGFVSVRTIGRERHCILRQEGFDQLRDWMAHFDAFWRSRLGRLEALLEAREQEHSSSSSKTAAD